MIVNTDKIMYKDVLSLFLIKASKFSAIAEYVENLASHTEDYV